MTLPKHAYKPSRITPGQCGAGEYLTPGHIRCCGLAELHEAHNQAHCQVCQHHFTPWPPLAPEPLCPRCKAYVPEALKTIMRRAELETSKTQLIRGIEQAAIVTCFACRTPASYRRARRGLEEWMHEGVPPNVARVTQVCDASRIWDLVPDLPTTPVAKRYFGDEVLTAPTADNPLGKPDSGDTHRLDWLMRNVSGAEFRRLGIVYAGGCTREDIDVAITHWLVSQPTAPPARRNPDYGCGHEDLRSCPRCDDRLALVPVAPPTENAPVQIVASILALIQTGYGFQMRWGGKTWLVQWNNKEFEGESLVDVLAEAVRSHRSEGENEE